MKMPCVVFTCLLLASSSAHALLEEPIPVPACLATENHCDAMVEKASHTTDAEGLGFIQLNTLASKNSGGCRRSCRKGTRKKKQKKCGNPACVDCAHCAAPPAQKCKGFCSKGTRKRKQKQCEKPACVDCAHCATTPEPQPLPETTDVFYDGLNMIHSRVENMHQLATEMLFSFDVEANGIEVTETHVIIPIVKSIQASYIRRMNGPDWDDEEVGVVVQKLAHQTMSLLGPDVNGGAVEKMHGFKRKQPVDMTSYDRAQKYVKPGNQSADDIAQKHYYTTAGMLMSKFGSQTIEASGIPNAEVKQFADDDGGEIPATMHESATSLRESMTQSFSDMEDADFLDPLFSFVNCMHWDNLEFDTAKTKLMFPLNKKLSSYRGHTVSAPWTAFDVLQGTSFFTHRPEQGKVELFFGVAIHSHWPDPEAEDKSPATIYVGSKGGVGQPVIIHPTNSYGSSMAAYKATAYAKSFHKEYTFLFQSPETLCPPAALAAIGQSLAELGPVFGRIMGGTSDEADQHAFVTYVASTLPCSVNFLKPDHLHGAEYGLYMASALAHALMEIPPRLLFSTLFARDWQEYSASLIRTHF